MDIMQQLSLIGIVPVIAINDAADAVPLAQALMEGGLPCAEVLPYCGGGGRHQEHDRSLPGYDRRRGHRSDLRAG